MVHRGHVKKGTIVLDADVTLPEGAEVAVEVLSEKGAGPVPNGERLHDGLDGLVGAAKGLPCDLAENHDRYLHGRDKQ
jgi:hypothetical protein